MTGSVAVPVKFENTPEGLLELLIGEGVAERIDRTVEVAEPVGDVIEKIGDARLSAEADDEGENMPRSPADDECTENDTDGANDVRAYWL